MLEGDVAAGRQILLQTADQVGVHLAALCPNLTQPAPNTRPASVHDSQVCCHAHYKGNEHSQMHVPEET